MFEEDTFDEVKTVPEHIRRIDLTELKPFDFQEKFMDSKCEKCLYYIKCKSGANGHFICHEDGREVWKWCSRHIGEAFYQYITLQSILRNKGLLTKETLADYQGSQSLECVKQLRLIAQMPDVYKGNYYLYGDNSTQKTTMAKALAKKLCYPIAHFKCSKTENQIVPISDDINVEYTSMNKIMKLIAKSMDYDVLKEEKVGVNTNLDTFRNARYLFIDESFDPSKATFYKTGFMIGELDELLRSRLEDRSKSTFFISNIKPEEIDEEIFGKSLKELVKRSMEQVLEFKDKYSSNRVPTRQVKI